MEIERNLLAAPQAAHQRVEVYSGVARLAKTDHVRLTKHKRSLFVSNDRRGFAGEPNVFRPFVLKQKMAGRLACFDGVAGHHHGHVRKAAHRKQILERLMGGAVRADGNAPVGTRDQDVEFPVADGGADLVQISGGGERRVGAEHRQLPFPRESGCDRRG
jgi:hypothetical protein